MVLNVSKNAQINLYNYITKDTGVQKHEWHSSSLSRVFHTEFLCIQVNTLESAIITVSLKRKPVREIDQKKYTARKHGGVHQIRHFSCKPNFYVVRNYMYKTYFEP